LLLPAQVLDTPVKTANRSEHVIFHQQCEEMLRGLESVEKTTTAIRQLLIQSAGHFLDIAQVAEGLNVSERTLRRRLEAESTSFRATVEEVRDLLAREYLTATELTVAEIAHLLDYSETVNFRRAFVRWNGVTPSEYRKQHMAENDSQGVVVPV
jgi:AraC-like DNA-binding protein